MKKVLILLCVCILSGCAQSRRNPQESLEGSLSIMANAPIEDMADNSKPLYRYYIEPSVGRRKSTQTSNVFIYQGQEFVMNLDIASIINTRFYDQVVFNQKANQNAMIAIDGTYIDCNNLVFNYSLSVYEFDNEKYYVDLRLAYVNFFAYCEYSNIESTVLEMMKIGKTVTVDAEEVITAYSSKQTTEYVKEKLDLFQLIIPDSGRVEELMGVSPGTVTEEEEISTENEIPEPEEGLIGDDEGSIMDGVE